MTRYTVADDLERIDRIALLLYGTEREGTVELLLAANPGTSTIGPFLPRGTVLVVPPRPPAKPNPNYQRPWD